MDNGRKKKHEANKQHYRTHAEMETKNKALVNETLKAGPDNVNENGKGHEVETMEINKKRNTAEVTAKAPSDQLNYVMDNGRKKKPEANKQHDRTHAEMETENEALVN